MFKKGFDKMKKFMMSEEAFDELINGFEYVGNLTKYGKENIKYHVQRLQQKNKNLEQALDEIKKILRQPQFEYDNIPCNYEDDIEKIKEIIQKTKEE